MHPRDFVRRMTLVGTLGVLGGSTALTASYLPWYEVVADLHVLGSTHGGAVAELSGWQAHIWGWVLPPLALTATVVALMVATERPSALTRDISLGAGMALAAAVGAGGLWFPKVARFDTAGTRLRDLTSSADRLPADMDLLFSVRPAIGMWLTLLAAAAIITFSFLSREV